MKKYTFLCIVTLIMGWGAFALAGSSHEGHGDATSASRGTMEHSIKADTFSHETVVEGVRAEFQVMSLAKMNMKDPEGNTHHVMVKFLDESKNQQLKDAIGKVKVISPSGKEQVANLKDYGGIFAANFTFKEKGKYGIICLFKIGGKKRLVKFWYPHG